jgi:hypothetical protein
MMWLVLDCTMLCSLLCVAFNLWILQTHWHVSYYYIYLPVDCGTVAIRKVLCSVVMERGFRSLFWSTVLSVAWRGTDFYKPDNITAQSNNLTHCNYSSVQRWDHYRLFPLSCLHFSVLKSLTAHFYVPILSGTCWNILYAFKRILPYVAEYLLVEYRV